jgi:hypothetical protein
MRRVAGILEVALIVVGLMVERPVLAAGSPCSEGPEAQGEGGAVVSGNVIVKAGTTCFMSGKTVQGNITVEPGATLSLESMVVKGSVAASSPNDIDIRNSYIGGNINTKGASNPAQSFYFCNNVIAGSSNSISNAPTVIFGDLGTSSPAACGASTGNDVCGSIAFTAITNLLRVQDNAVAGSGNFMNDPNVQFDGNHFKGTVAWSNTTFASNTGNTSRNIPPVVVNCSKAAAPLPPNAGTLACTPNPVDFGEVPTAQQTYGPRTVTCTASSGPVTVTSLSLSDTTNYGIQTENCTGVTLPATTSCTINVVFTPSYPGVFNGQTLAVSHSGSNPSPISITLNGSVSD